MSVSLPMPTWSMPMASTERLDAREHTPHRIREFGPDADHAAGVGDHLGVLLADQARGHHFRHPRVFARPLVEAGVGDDHRLRGHLHPRPSTVVWLAWARSTTMPSRLHSLTTAAPKRGQAAQAGGLGVNVAERLDRVAFVV